VLLIIVINFMMLESVARCLFVTEETRSFLNLMLGHYVFVLFMRCTSIWCL